MPSHPPRDQDSAPDRAGPPAPGPDSVMTPDVDPAATSTPAAADAERPDLGATGHAIESHFNHSVSITVLAVLAVLYTLYFARSFLLPIVIAFLLSFLFSPLVRAMARMRIRPPAGAGIVILGLLATVTFAGYELSYPVQSWAASAPQTLQTAQHKMKEMLKPLERASKTAEQVQNAAGGVAGGGAARTPEVVVRGESIISRVFGTTQRFVTAALETLILLYFLLAAGDLFLQKLIKVLPTRSDKRKAVEIARKTEASISTYLLTTAAVNITEGAVVALTMWILGMPSPLLWGAMVALLEFVPYLGALTMTVVLSIAALTVYDTVGQAMLVPGAFLVINIIQGNFVSPMLMGHKLALNPVALLVGLTFWFWIWGIPGAFLAVPLMATFKILCDHIESLAAIGEFLGMRDENERRAAVRS
jgi:predicted PurR-regulated permease PerM